MDVNSVPIVLCNLYAPNVNDLELFKKLTIHIDTLVLETIIMGGDFNFIVTNSLAGLHRHSNNWNERNYFVV